MKSSRVSFLCGALLLTLPLAALVPGCGGGGESLFNAKPTATPTSNSVVLLTNAIVALGNGQTGALSVARSGNRASGVLTIGTSTAQAQKGTSATLFTVPTGIYAVSGTFSAPRRLTLRGNFPAPTGAFSLAITLPTATEDGSYSITVGGQTFNGLLPRNGGIINPTATPTTGATATPTPRATATPTPNNPIGFQGTAVLDSIGSGIKTIDATGNSRVQRIGNSDTITGQYLFKVGTQTAIFQTFGTFSPRLENRAYTPGVSGSPTYNIILTQSNRTFNSYAGDGSITYTGTQNGVLSFRFQNVAFTERGKSPSAGFLVLNGTGTLTDAR